MDSVGAHFLLSHSTEFLQMTLGADVEGGFTGTVFLLRKWQVKTFLGISFMTLGQISCSCR